MNSFTTFTANNFRDIKMKGFKFYKNYDEI